MQYAFNADSVLEDALTIAFDCFCGPLREDNQANAVSSELKFGGAYVMFSTRTSGVPGFMVESITDQNFLLDGMPSYLVFPRAMISEFSTSGIL